VGGWKRKKGSGEEGKMGECCAVSLLSFLFSLSSSLSLFSLSHLAPRVRVESGSSGVFRYLFAALDGGKLDRLRADGAD